MSFAVVLAGGAMPERRLVAGAAHAKIVIAADGGVRIARNHGLPIHLVIGDLDSISPGDLAWAKAEGAGIVSFSPDKDFTDLELALERADESAVDKIVATGVEGGRLDHELGNWSALCARRNALVEVHAANGTATILHGDGNNRLTQTGQVGDIISLLPRAGEAIGITTRGLRWPLDNTTLSSTGTHGISNEFLSTSATIELESGILMVVRPRVCALDD